jgi:hypothetical protein
VILALFAILFAYELKIAQKESRDFKLGVVANCQDNNAIRSELIKSAEDSIKNRPGTATGDAIHMAHVRLIFAQTNCSKVLQGKITKKVFP